MHIPAKAKDLRCHVPGVEFFVLSENAFELFFRGVTSVRRWNSRYSGGSVRGS